MLDFPFFSNAWFLLYNPKTTNIPDTKRIHEKLNSCSMFDLLTLESKHLWEKKYISSSLFGINSVKSAGVGR